jgi:hypothetical protein
LLIVRGDHRHHRRPIAGPPCLLRARISGNEASAIGSLRAVSSAQSTFAASCANGMYAQGLATLGTGPSGGSAFISPDLGAAATATKSGYNVSMAGSSATGTAVQRRDRSGFGLPRVGGPRLDVDRHALLRHQHDGHDLAEHREPLDHDRRRDPGFTGGRDSVTGSRT